MKLNTVNVIEYISGAVHGITSFEDTCEDNRTAEKLFKRLVKKNYKETTDEDIEVCLDNGYFEQDDYQVFITHSN